jgi:hypothetical protein
MVWFEETWNASPLLTWRRRGCWLARSGLTPEMLPTSSLTCGGSASACSCHHETVRTRAPGPGALLVLPKLSPSRSFALAPPSSSSSSQAPPARRRPHLDHPESSRRGARAVGHGDADGGRGLQGPHPCRRRSSSHHRHHPHSTSLLLDAIHSDRLLF